MSDGLTPDGFYNANQVAELVFGRGSVWFSRHRKALDAEGFPPPISKIGRPRWRGRMLIEWLERRPAPILPDGEKDWTTILKNRAEALHGGNRDLVRRHS